MLLALAKRLPQIKILDTKFLAGSENKVVFFCIKVFTKTSKSGKQPPDKIFYCFTENEILLQKF